MSDNRIISADEVLLPDDIINYINAGIKKKWNGVSATWKFKDDKSRAEFDRLKEAVPVIKQLYKERGWDVFMGFDYSFNIVTFRITKI